MNALSKVALLATLFPTAASAALVSADVTGFSHDLVVGESETSPPGGNNASMNDGGGAPANATFYGVGFNTADPMTGLPVGTAVSEASSDLTFTLQPFAEANNALMLGGAAGESLSGTLSLLNPTASTRLALIGSTGNGAGDNTIIVNYLDGSNEAFSGLTEGINSDWFFVEGQTYTANGRVNEGTFSAVNSGNPRLHETILTLGNNSSPVTSVDITNNGDGHTAVMAVSVEAVPEPSAALLGALAGLLGLTRRRRRA
jgi:hypothetical protein